MIPFASQRGNGQDLATHLLNAHDNETVEVMQVKGAIARDLHGAFEEWELQADILTKCKKYLYSLSINPDPEQGALSRDQYLDYIARVEEKLGLAGQPRAVVFHEKHGREHCHVVWSRINADQQKAVQISFDKEKLMVLTRQFAHEHGLGLPGGYSNNERGEQKSLYELEQERKTGLSKADHQGKVTEAWQQSDSATAFIQALAGEGYMLAKGDRGYLIVDFYGGHYALSRLINDTAIKAKQVRERLADELPLGCLPDLAEAKKQVAEYRNQVEKFGKEDAHKEEIAELERQQEIRRRKLHDENDLLVHRQRALKLEQNIKHRQERNELRAAYQGEKVEAQLKRYKNRPTGLAEFLGRISGVNLIRKKLHRYQDSQRLRAYRENRKGLQKKQRRDGDILAARLSLQSKEIARQRKALNRVERRERQSLINEQKLESRIDQRGQYNEIPSLEKVLGLDKTKANLAESAQPDLMAEFSKAVNDKAKGGRGSTGSGDLSSKFSLRPGRSRKPKPDRDR